MNKWLSQLASGLALMLALSAAVVPVLTNRIPIEEGVRYFLWMQHVPIPGTGSFRLIEIDVQTG